jgi:hypothetical protein
MATAKAQLDGFVAKYSPEVAKLGRAAIARMRKLLRAAQVLVYDNYNALAVGFGPSERYRHHVQLGPATAAPANREAV